MAPISAITQSVILFELKTDITQQSAGRTASFHRLSAHQSNHHGGTQLMVDEQLAKMSGS